MALSNDQLESVREGLGILLAVSNVAVWAGVLLENERFSKTTQEKGWRLLLVALAGEAAIGILLLWSDTILAGRQQIEIASLNRQAAGLATDLGNARSEVAKDGVTIGALSGNLEGMQRRMSQAEQAIERLQNAPHTPSPPPSVSIAPSGTPNPLTEDAKRAIRETTKSGAIISIIPFMPNLERFASDLGAVFATVPGVQVAVGHGNLIMNGQTGLIVQFDHKNPTSASVFAALSKAGLNPIDGPATPGTPIVFIKVAPQ